MKQIFFALIAAFALAFPIFAAETQAQQPVPQVASETAEQTVSRTSAGSAPSAKDSAPEEDMRAFLSDVKDLKWTNISNYLSTHMTIIAILILLCACATKLSSYMNMPTLIVFLGVGMLLRNDVLFNNPMHANLIGSVAMAFILFSGGFSTNWKSVKDVAFTGGILSTAGVLLTAVIFGTVTYFLSKIFLPDMKLSFSWCLLLGSIVSSTDAAAVFTILRSRKVSLRPQLKAVLEFESGSNDPMAAFLTVFFVSIVLKEMSTGTAVPFSEYKAIVPQFFAKMFLGSICGYAWGKILVWIFNKINLEYDGLYYALGVGAVMLSYGSTEWLNGNGFMAVYVTGIIMGNSKFIYHNSVGRFSEGMAWLMQVFLFSMLGLLFVQLGLFTKYSLTGLICGIAASLVLMFLARPLATFAGMMFSKFSFKERLLVSWVGLRGGAPIMLATFPLIAKITDNELMFYQVFFVVIMSIIFQGMTIMPVAKYLKLDAPLKVSPRIPLEFDNTGTMDGETCEYEIHAGSPCIGKTLAQLSIPEGVLILLIRRNGKHLIPKGNTVLQENDSLMALGKEDELNEFSANLQK